MKGWRGGLHPKNVFLRVQYHRYSREPSDRDVLKMPLFVINKSFLESVEQTNFDTERDRVESCRVTSNSCASLGSCVGAGRVMLESNPRAIAKG